MEEKLETTIQGSFGLRILGLLIIKADTGFQRDHAKEHGNYYLEFRV